MKLIKRLGIGLAIGLGVAVLGILGFFGFSITQDRITETQVAEQFWNEIEYTNGIQVTNVLLFGGSSRVDAIVNGDTPVGFWYGKSGVSGFWRVGPYAVTRHCFLINESGEPYEKVYQSDLAISNELHSEIFPFTLHTLQDVVDYSDEVIAILDSAPRKPDSYLDLEKGDPLLTQRKWFTTTEYQGDPVRCYLHVTEIDW